MNTSRTRHNRKRVPLGNNMRGVGSVRLELGECGLIVLAGLALGCALGAAPALAEHPCVEAVCDKEYKPSSPFDRAVNKFQIELRKQCLAQKKEVIERCKKLMSTEGLSAEQAAKRAEEEVAGSQPSQGAPSAPSRPATMTTSPPSEEEKRYQAAYDEAFQPCAATCLAKLNACLKRSQTDEERGLCERDHEGCEAACRDVAHEAARRATQ